MTVSKEKTSLDHRQKIARFLERIVINAGVGRLSNQPNFEEKGLVQIMSDIASISGQKPQIRRAKKSIAGFKIRQGQIVGVKATLRKKRMIDFFERLIKIILPRVRDFSGLDAKTIDAGGVLSVGLREQLVFPEISPEKSPISFSLGISVVPRRKNREASIKMLEELGVPLRRRVGKS